ncbi:MAG: DUF2975 domain-containing protein [Anaerolineae bacterium]|nr:DUF2975 domain-containing protein [Anaerolineae bacterium]
MSSSQQSKLIRVVQIIIDVIFGGLVFASGFLILWIIFTPLILKTSDISITASIPVAIGANDHPQLPVEVVGATGKGIRAAFVSDAQGTLQLETTTWSYIIISNIAKLLTALMLAYIFYLLRTVLRSIRAGSPFAPENAVRIRRLGYLVLLVSFLRPTVEYFAANEILNQLTITSPSILLPSPFKVEMILISLLILIVAQVWSYGLELERDQELTI